LAGAAPEYIVDTSVVLKWFVSEDGADIEVARALRDDHVGGRCSLFAPDFMLLELANSLKSGRRFSAPEVGLILRSLRHLELQIEPVRWETLNHAVAIASRYRTAVYDSYFLARAIESGATLVSADDAFLRRVGPHPNAILLRGLRLAD
jgi:predicted nucleic acid-binding protein